MAKRTSSIKAFEQLSGRFIERKLKNFNCKIFKHLSSIDNPVEDSFFKIKIGVRSQYDYFCAWHKAIPIHIISTKIVLLLIYLNQIKPDGYT